MTWQAKRFFESLRVARKMKQSGCTRLERWYYLYLFREGFYRGIMFKESEVANANH